VSSFKWCPLTHEYRRLNDGVKITEDQAFNMRVMWENNADALMRIFGNTDEGFATALEFLSEQARVAQGGPNDK
jgi:hypothetical protein